LVLSTALFQFVNTRDNIDQSEIVGGRQNALDGWIKKALLISEQYTDHPESLSFYPFGRVSVQLVGENLFIYFAFLVKETRLSTRQFIH
jgi:hypothetical protein